MNTRQTRLSSPEQIQANINKLIGKKINIVLQDNMVFLGVLMSVAGNEITIRNMRNKKVTLLMSNIYELFVDTLT